MPWCPKCKIEYREGFSKCADCEVDLVEELPPEPESQEESFQDVELAFLLIANSNMEASMFKSFLEANDIPTVTRLKYTGSYLNILLGDTIMGVDLYVPVDCLDKARELVDVYFSSNPVIVQDDDCSPEVAVDEGMNSEVGAEVEDTASVDAGRVESSTKDEITFEVTGKEIDYVGIASGGTAQDAGAEVDEASNFVVDESDFNLEDVTDAGIKARLSVVKIFIIIFLSGTVLSIIGALILAIYYLIKILR
jgi:hypothetical protein